MSDTPRTDLCASHEGNWDTKALRMTAHSESLERELNTAKDQLSIANEGLDAAYQQGYADGRDSRDPDMRAYQCAIIELRNKLTIAEDNLHGLIGYRLSGPDRYESMADFIDNATDEDLQEFVAWTKERRRA